MALEGLEHRPVTYPDGETFLARAELASEDWVIIDLGLPGISGVDVIRKIRHLPDPPRILAITGKPQARLLTHLKALPGLKNIAKAAVHRNDHEGDELKRCHVIRSDVPGFGRMS
ncbi:response regulator [Roseibium salinum]|nr:response regulator [Roseibium salinum]